VDVPVAGKQPVDRVLADHALARELAEAEKTYEAIGLRHEEAKRRRNELIREARARRWPYAEIGRAMGLSRQRVGQIVRGYGKGAPT
jgi:hypothetical protein